VDEYCSCVLGKLPRLLPTKELEFKISLKLGIELIVRMPYRMLTPKLQELKMQLKELLGLGIIYPRV